MIMKLTCTVAAAMAALALFASLGTAAEPPLRTGDQLHVAGVKLFRQGRYAEAYGRFVALANGGHPASADYALWMCMNGPTLFGSDWDCSVDEVQDWLRTSAEWRRELLRRRAAGLS